MSNTIFDTLIGVSIVGAFVIFVYAKMTKRTFKEALSELWSKIGGENE